MIRVTDEVFACYEKACAPPPAGRGGSSKGGPSRRKLHKMGRNDLMEEADPLSGPRKGNISNKEMSRRGRAIDEMRRRGFIPPLGKTPVKKGSTDRYHDPSYDSRGVDRPDGGYLTPRV